MEDQYSALERAREKLNRLQGPKNDDLPEAPKKKE